MGASFGFWNTNRARARGWKPLPQKQELAPVGRSCGNGEP